MPATQSMIVLEFNELTPSLMQRFMANGRLPHFRRLHDEAHVYVTDAEEEGENLNPWVQWVTAHSGMAAAEHGVLRLGEGRQLAQGAVWDLLSDAGQRVWVCGSMNSRYDAPLNGYLLPDPWSVKQPPFPRGVFDSFLKFVQKNVQEHTNDQLPLSRMDTLKFMGFMISHGLSLSTVRAVCRQLLSERGGHGRWKRAALFDRFLWDVFRWFYRKTRPNFATFFSNSTAFYQHRYWRNMEPEAFAIKPSAEEQKEYGGAILYGYQQMDDLVRRCLKLAGPDTTILFCTGLGQQPYLRAEEMGGKWHYRIKKPELIADKLGVRGRFAYEPVMAEDFYLRFGTEGDSIQAETLLLSYSLQGEQAFQVSRTGQDVFLKCNYHKRLSPDARLVEANSGRSVPFFDVFYQADGLKSGFHHPHGILWIRYPHRQHRVHEEPVSLRSIAPTILQLFGVPRPDFMKARPLVPAASGPSAGSRRVRALALR